MSGSLALQGDGGWGAQLQPWLLVNFDRVYVVHSLIYQTEKRRARD